MANFQPSGTSPSFQMENIESNRMYEQILKEKNFQKQMQMIQKQFNDQLEKQKDKFKADSEGMVILKPYQCKQCLQEIESESNLKIHIKDCKQFSCKYFICRDKSYYHIFVSRENFRSEEKFDEHIKEKHITKKINNDENINSEKKVQDQNKFTDDQNKFADYINKFNSEEKFKAKEILDERTSQQSIKIENLEKENFQIKEKLDKLNNEKQESVSKVVKLQRENENLKSKNTELLLINAEINEKLDMKNKEDKSSSNQLQALIKAFHAVEKDFYKSKETNAKHDFRDVTLACEDKQIKTHETNNYSDEKTLGARKKSYECNKCSDMFTTKSDLQQHNISQCSTYNCEQCQQIFLNKSELQEHIKVHEENLKCKQCPTKFTNKSDIQEHMKVHMETHTDTETVYYSCEVCPKKFSKKKDVDKHVDAHLYKSFCHKFNNFPKCNFGKECIFLHEKAPLCSYDGYCTRPSCQYQHKYGCIEKNRAGNNYLMRKKMKKETDEERNKVRLERDEKRSSKEEV